MSLPSKISDCLFFLTYPITPIGPYFLTEYRMFRLSRLCEYRVVLGRGIGLGAAFVPEMLLV